MTPSNDKRYIYFKYLVLNKKMEKIASIYANCSRCATREFKIKGYDKQHTLAVYKIGIGSLLLPLDMSKTAPCYYDL